MAQKFATALNRQPETHDDVTSILGDLGDTKMLPILTLQPAVAHVAGASMWLGGGQTPREPLAKTLIFNPLRQMTSRAGRTRDFRTNVLSHLVSLPGATEPPSMRHQAADWA